MSVLTSPAPVAPAGPTPSMRRDDERVNIRSSIPFFAFHLSPLAIIWTGVTARALAVGVVFYAIRMLFITAGYHRYFSHRSFTTGRVMQFVLAFGGTTATQKGPLWWAANHRTHHRFADTDRDPHSPAKGFWWSHMGWIVCDRYGGTDLEAISDFSRFPELRFLNRFDFIGPWTAGIAAYLIAGPSGLVVGFFCSTIVLWHATFTVNSLAHLFGRRRYDTPDTSRNFWPVALATGGEGWHNNHHRFPRSAKHGQRWWQIDPTYWVLRSLATIGLVRDLKRPPRAVSGA